MLARIVATILRVIRKSRYSAGSMAQDYLAIWTQAAADLATGDLSRDDFLSTMEDQLNNYGEDIYQAAAGAAYAMDNEDYKLIQDFVDSQTPYLEGLADDVIAAGAVTPELQNRLRMWAESLQSLGAVGYITANPRQIGEWRVGNTEKHCIDCLSLDGETQPLQWFLDNGYLPGQPGSPGLDCGGWNCGCGIFDVQTGRRLLPLVQTWHSMIHLTKGGG